MAIKLIRGASQAENYFSPSHLHFSTHVLFLLLFFASLICSTVYKCVCQQYADKMYSSLIELVTTYLRRVSEELQVIYLSVLILELKDTKIKAIKIYLLSKR